jgi:hypothetical protein
VKNICKVCSIVNRQNFTPASILSEISPTGEIGNSPTEITEVTFLHRGT